MSEQNMATVLDAIEQLYRSHRRHDVTSTLTTLMIDGISSHAMLLDSFVVLHAAFISSLHRLIGVEFAAFVVQNVVSAYELTDVTTQTDERGKECSNLIVLLSELYNFQVISCILLYDIIKDLLGKTLSEFRVELLLKILRSSGQQLRQDDPSALKDIVTLAQSSIANQGDSLSSRTKFMIETLTNLKNNKIKKSATQHQGGDAVERMKKFLSGLGKKRHVQAHEALRVSLDDLRAAETKGKWWLVGAAWGGDPLQNEADAEDISNTALVKLARKQGMNTDIRRSIFVVLMSSDDYLDACERLAQLNLSEVQQREIVRVILHCCGNEKSYNPYYALVCQQLCQRSHAYRITLQFCLWDFFRELGETNVGGAEVIKNLKHDDGRFDHQTVSSSRTKNLATAYGWWIAKDCCSITVLKPVDVTRLKPHTRTFLRELLVQIFVASQASSPVLTDDYNEQTSRNRSAVEDVFIKATKTENLGLGLIYFLSNAFREEEGLLGWASALAKETLQTGMNEIPRL
ncbi:ARM repeat-containing protein, partial [Boletus edulis]